MRLLKILFGAMATVVVAAAPAAAQYPGTTSTTVAPTSQTAGTLAVGSETTILSCGFRPGTATATVNGASAGSDTVDADGCVRSTLAVLGTSQVRVDGTTTAATCTNDVLAVTGTGANGAARTVTTSFGIDCPGGTLPRTGTSIVPWALAGGALLGFGALLVVVSRRRRSVTTA